MKMGTRDRQTETTEKRRENGENSWSVFHTAELAAGSRWVKVDSALQMSKSKRFDLLRRNLWKEGGGLLFHSEGRPDRRRGESTEEVGDISTEAVSVLTRKRQRYATSVHISRASGANAAFVFQN